MRVFKMPCWIVTNKYYRKRLPEGDFITVMDKKYQFFISSTYEDLKVEREKAIFTILEMEQFPVGMELFSAADEDQWDVISQTIDTSDYYIIIVGNRYGSIIPEPASDAGISYTEKEFNYAVGKGIPVLAFIKEGAEQSNESHEALAKLENFTNKVKSGRYVKSFNNPDQLATFLSQSIHKAIRRNNRPGWVRTTDFNIEESHARILQLTERIHTLEALNADLKVENNRRPDLSITYRLDPEILDEDGMPYGNEPTIKDGVIYFHVQPVYMDDARDGIKYKNVFDEEVNVSENDVRLLRHFFQNGFSLLYHIVNEGTARATGVRVHMEIPDELLVTSNQEIYEYIEQPMINPDKEVCNGRMRTLFAPASCESNNAEFLSIDELLANEDITDLLDSGELDVSPGEINIEFEEIRHKDSQFYRGAYLYPTRAGEFEIICNIMCNELAEAIVQVIKIVVD